MSYGVPLPNSLQVFAEISKVVERTTRYLSPSDWDIRRLDKLAEQLDNANKVEGANARAAIWQLTGDRDIALRHIDYAIEHAEHPDFYRTCKVVVLANLGYFSEAAHVFKSSSAPEQGNMTNAWPRGYFCGAFRTMKSYLPKATKMQFDLGSLDIDTAERAANVMEKAGVKDEDVARVLDAAGHVLRSHRLFFVGDGLKTNVYVLEDSGDAFIELSFELDATAKEVHALYREFVDQVTRSVPYIPSVLTVSFRTWTRQNERNAA